jgi:hypothetical protein
MFLMPFETKFDEGDDAVPERDGQIELPDDMALMADQLRDDAQRLAACYPPRLGPVADVAAAVALVSQARQRSAGRSALWISSAVGGLTALGVLLTLSLVFGFGWNRIRDGANSQPEPSIIRTMADGAADRDGTSEIVSSAPATVRTVGLVPDELPTPASFTGAMPTVTTAVLRSGISGPEMEAWIDLRRDELAMEVESIEF